MNDDLIRYYKKRKILLEREIERLKLKIIDLRNEIEFYDRQIKKAEEADAE